MMHGNGWGFNWEGQYDVSLLTNTRNGATARMPLSPSLKVCMFVGQ